MKRISILTIVPVALISIEQLSAQNGVEPPVESANKANPQTVGILPLQRQGYDVVDEPNPYTLLSQKKKQAVTKREFSQEDRIREVLSGLQVTGVVNNGRKILLGDMILEEEEILPKVLPDQTEELIVKEITEQYLDLEWIEKKRARRSAVNKKPRMMRIPIQMRTRVEALVKGQTGGGGSKQFHIVRLPGEDPSDYGPE